MFPPLQLNLGGASVSVSVTDAAVVADGPAILAALAVADAGSSADLPAVRVLASVQDSAASADTLAVLVRASVADTAAAADTLAQLQALLALGDAVSVADLVVAGAPGSEIARASILLRVRTMTGEVQVRQFDIDIDVRRIEAALSGREARFTLRARRNDVH